MAEFIGGLIIFVLGMLTEGFRFRRSEQANYLNELIEEIRRTEDYGTEFWALDHTAPSNSILQIKVRASCFMIAQFEELAEKCFAGLYADYQTAVDNLFDTVMGGEFETANRATDHETALEVRRQAALLISIVRKARVHLGTPIWVFKRLYHAVAAWPARYQR